MLYFYHEEFQIKKSKNIPETFLASKMDMHKEQESQEEAENFYEWKPSMQRTWKRREQVQLRLLNFTGDVNQVSRIKGVIQKGKFEPINIIMQTKSIYPSISLKNYYNYYCVNEKSKVEMSGIENY